MVDETYEESIADRFIDESNLRFLQDGTTFGNTTRDDIREVIVKVIKQIREDLY